MDLDSFEKVMAAMDDQLSRATGKSIPPPPKPKSNAKTALDSLSKLPTEADIDDMDDDDLLAMDRELRAALKSAGVEDDEDDMGVNWMWTKRKSWKAKIRGSIG